MRIAIIVSQFNNDIGDRLLQGAKKGLRDSGVSEKQYIILSAPGAFELPFVAKRIIRQKKVDGIIALGCVLKGETDHYQAVCDGVTYGLQKISLEENIPILFGVLMCKTKALALARVKNDKTNKGYECAVGLINLLN